MTLRFILVSFLLWQLSTVAQAAPWYQVELMLVAYTNNASLDNETWQESIAPLAVQANSPDFRWWLTPSINHHNALIANYGFSETPTASWQHPMQSLANLELSNVANRISQRSDMKILWHKAWVEPIQEQDNAIVHPINVQIEGGPIISLTGSFSLYLSRFLHINTDLVMQHSRQASAQEIAEMTASLNDLVDDLMQTEVNENEPAFYPSETQAEFESESEAVLIPIRAANIQLQRRMRSKELHYIDHPMLGVIVRVNPVLN